MKGNPKKSILDVNAVKSVYVESCYEIFMSSCKKSNNNDDITDVLRKVFFCDSNPRQIDDYHEMSLFSLSLYIRKISNMTTEIQRLKKELRRPRLDC